MTAASAAFESQQGQLTAQIAQLQAQLSAVRQQAGPPEVLLLAKAIAERVASVAAAHPDLGALHFAGVKDQASRLSEAVSAAVDGKGPVADAERLANSIGTWFTRTHPRTSGKFLEGSHSVLDEAERIIEGLGELAPVAAAIASAV
jgi:hypothetical protein